MRRLILFPCIAWVAVLAPGASWAHEVQSEPERDGWTLFLAIGLLCAFMLFARGWIRFRRARSPAASAGALLCFCSGMAVLAAALSPAFHSFADQLFSAHMVQHLLLILVAGPLLALGRAGFFMTMGLPRIVRRPIGRVAASTGLPRMGMGAAGALLGWLAFSGVFVFWHLPGPYRWSLGSEPVHVLEHLTLLASSYAFWRVVVAPDAAAFGYGGRILYVATAATLSGLPGALMILATRSFYDGHLHGAAKWGLSPVEDQQLAGLIMWIPGGFVYLGAICWLTQAWLRDAERRASARTPPAPAARADPIASEAALARLAPMASVLLAVLALVGCQAEAARPGQGDPRSGARLITETGCGACHVIPGIGGANGLVGPPLTQIGRRVYIAGLLRNTPDDMVAWLRNPQAIVPGNAMPNMGLSESQARDIAAYLATIR